MSKITQKNKKEVIILKNILEKKHVEKLKEECKQKEELLEVNITEKSNIIN